jgi:transposase
MDVVYSICAGLDVHKDTIKACLRTPLEGKRMSTIQTFGTTTRELLRLAAWLTEAQCAQVAMESTGVYWQPVYHVLEGSVGVLWVNAAHIKQVPGRKTDVKDGEWIAHLLECGLLKASFIPPPPIREVRAVTRHRKTLIQERARVANRIQKLLESANLKLGSVASDILGVAAQAILRALVAGERDNEQLAALAKGKLRAKPEQLHDALLGRFTAHHAFLLKQLLAQVEFVSAQITECDQEVETLCRPFAQTIEQLQTLPGVGQRGAEQIIAELGVEMARFPTAQHAASWVGICPGNHESAGKHKSGKTRKGNRWLRALLVECAWAASRTKASYFHAQFRQLTRRRGAKRAAVAVGHSLLIAAYHIIRDGVPHQDLGPDHFDTLHRQRLTSYHTRRLEELGYRVNLETKEAA